MDLFLYFIDEKSFVLKYSNDNENLQSSEQYRARLLGTVHLLSRDSPSCLSFNYKLTDEKSTKLSVFVDNRTIWRSRIKSGQRFDKEMF